jgi:hypothetical protein
LWVREVRDFVVADEGALDMAVAEATARTLLGYSPIAVAHFAEITINTGGQFNSFWVGSVSLALS